MNSPFLEAERSPGNVLEEADMTAFAVPCPGDMPDESIVHYGPGGQRPLCGAESWLAVHTEDPVQVRGCQDCLELVEEDLGDQNHYAGRCLHCRQEITAQGGVAWRRAVRKPCPHCGRPGW